MKNSKLKLIILTTFVEILILFALTIKLGTSGNTTVRWTNVFPYIGILSVMIYIMLLIYMSKFKNYLIKITKIICGFIQNYSCEIFMLSLSVYLIIYEIYYAYCENIFISPDSGNYLREATALVNGYGFNVSGPAGTFSWFSNWPIGYPCLIALVALLTGQNVYLSSKILSILLVIAGMLFFYKCFKKKAWIFCLIYCNIGFLDIYKYTWSENPFILCFILYTFLLAEIITNKNPQKKKYTYLMICSFLTFLMRYFGGITVIITALVIVGYILLFFCFREYHTATVKDKIIKLIVTNILSSILMIGYWAINKIKTGRISGVDRLKWTDDYLELTENLYSALKTEVLNASRISSFKTIDSMDTGMLAVIMLFISLSITGLMFNQIKKGIDYKVICIAAGIVYYLLFIVVRYYSYMDLFGYRFFVPGTMLIMIGLLGFIEEKLESLAPQICIFATALLIPLIFSLFSQVFVYNTSSTAYASVKKEILSELEEVPTQSVLPAYDENIYITYVMRPDITLYKKDIDTTLELDQWIKQYSAFPFVCIKTSVLEENVLNQESSESFLNLLGNIKKSQSTNSYIVLSTNDGSVKN